MDVGIKVDPSVPARTANSADIVNHDDDVDGSERVRIQPIDTRLRLHFKQAQQGASVRSKANFGNTHMMAWRPGPVNMSIAKMVESGMTYVQARKTIARATREQHHQFVREGEQHLAREMSFREVQERAKNAHTLGTAVVTNKIERMHWRGREQQARCMLVCNEAIKAEQRRQPKVRKVKNWDFGSDRKLDQIQTRGRPVFLGDDPHDHHAPVGKTEVPNAFSQDLPTSEFPRGPIGSENSRRDGSHLSGNVGVVKGQHQSQQKTETEDTVVGHQEKDRGERGGGENIGGGVQVGIKGDGGGGKGGALGDSNDVAFVLRKLYTGGGLDAQQQSWECMPNSLFNTLTLQMGTLSKINMPRNSLELLISLRNPNFSCAHMRSVAEINLSGNKLRELPEDSQRLTSLKTLRLDNNKLSSLPDGLLTLTSLTHLSLRHNNFSKLPYRFGDLHRLQKLDMGENMLKTLPPTMVLLTSLLHLKLDGNSMPHLAIPPLLKTSNGKDQSTNWSKRWNREKKREMWMNSITGAVSDVDPTSSSAVRSSNSSECSVHTQLTEGTGRYNRRRNELAARGIYEWEAALNVSTGKVYYINNVNFSNAQAMPACMNRLGDMTRLVSLKLSQNKLRSLPSSICWCHFLEVLEANENYLEKLPAKLGEMKRLRYLRLDVNCLSELPRSMVHLERLEELCLTSNFFATFPDFIMKVSSLKKLLLGNNQLKKLPYSVGFLKSLKTLQLYNNPLADPPAELLLLGIDSLLWECRRRHWLNVRGPPPVVRVHGFGIEEEKLELLPEFERKLAKNIETAGKTGELNFMMEGLTYFPMGVFQEEVGRNLKGLRLDSNDFSNTTIVFRHTWQDLEKVTHSVSLCHLVVLSLKKCKLRRLGDDLAELGSLKQLYLENNLILILPDAVTRLRTLEILDVKKNRLQDCPEGIGSLSRLKRLELDENRLEVLPPSLSQLTHLEVLSLSSNHVYQLPEEMVGLEKLKALDANGNMLTQLPPGFGALRLRSLKISYNRIETLRHEVFRPSLKGTLRQLWLSNNNLLQLPDSVIELSKVKDVQMDSNPYKSPPPELFAEGIAAVMMYVRVRMQRIELMHKLIIDRGFETSLEVLLPECCGVLMTNTGYLTPTDLDEFDKAVDRFINGDYYRHPLTAEAILDIAKELKSVRKREFYERMVAHLMQQVFFEETRKTFSENIFCRHTTRPWGQRGGPVGCLAIALSALFDDTEKNAFVEEFRPGLWTEAKKTLPRSVFEYSRKVLRKALLTLRSAYGPIAAFEDVTFEFCECVDSKTGEELRHPKGKCVVPGMVVVKIIYTEEEARRREEENKEVFEVLTKTNNQVREWLKSKQGAGRATDEVKTRRAIQSFRIGVIDASIGTLEGMSEVKQEMLAFTRQRKMQFDNGEPFHFHSLENEEQAIALVEAAEKEVNDIHEQRVALELEKAQLKETLKEKSSDVTKEVENNLLDKYCHVEYTSVFERNRTRALKQGWRRPWDGMDGEDFRNWAKDMNCIAADRHERPENVADYAGIEVPKDDRNWDEAPSDLGARLNWDGTDNMATFLVPTLVEWKERRAARIQAKLDPDVWSSDEEQDGSNDSDDSDDKSDEDETESDEGDHDRRDMDESGGDGVGDGGVAAINAPADDDIIKR